MPLIRGYSKDTISKNIGELENSRSEAGKMRSHKQNIAIALDMARRSGGKIPRKKKKA